MRTPADRVAWAATQVGTTHWNGQCEAFTRHCFPFEAMYSSAHVAWEASAAAGPVHAEYDAPPGVPVFFDIINGSNAGYDHVALSAGDGYCYSDNAGPGGTLVLVGIAELTARWGMTYRGWAEVYHGVRVYDPHGTDTTDPLEVLMSWYASKEEFRADIADLIARYVPKAYVHDGRTDEHGDASEVWLSTAQGWTLSSLRELKGQLEAQQAALDKIIAALDE